jgi:tetratricopeptide (TPR) repeat protein
MLDIEQRRKVQDLIQKGRYDSAEKVLNFMLKQDPQEASTHNTLGDVLIKLNNVKEALEHFGEAAELYFSNGLHSAALSVARKALRIDENYANAHYIKARSLDRQEKQDQAGTEYVLFLKAKPPVSDPSVLRSCHAMTRLEPENDKWVIRMAKVAATVDDEVALDICVSLALERGMKEHGQFSAMLGKVRQKLGAKGGIRSSLLDDIEFEEADFVEGEPVESEPGIIPASGRRRLGEYFVAEHLLDAADVLRALEVQAASPEKRKLGDILVALHMVSARQVQEALSKQVEDLRTNLDRTQGDGLGYVELGNLLLDVGDFYGAIDAYLRACTIYRANEREYMVFELLEGVLDICPESLSAAKELVRIREAMDPEGQARGFYRLAVAYLLNDSPHEALAALQASVEIYPRFEMAVALMEGIRPGLASGDDYADIALILADIDNRFESSAAKALAGIIHEFQEGIHKAVSHDDYNTHYDLGIAYMEMGLHRESLTEFEKVLTSPEHRVKAREMLGRCCIRLERYDEAEDHFRKGLMTSSADMHAAVGFHLALSGVYQLTGRDTQSERELELARKLDPEMVRMKSRLE